MRICAVVHAYSSHACKHLLKCTSALARTQALTHRSMRPRHWEEIMRICGVELNLAEDHFKLQHLLDCNLLRHREEVEELTGAWCCP